MDKDKMLVLLDAAKAELVSPEVCHYMKVCIHYGNIPSP